MYHAEETMRTLTISQVFVTISIADFKFFPTSGTACTTEPRILSAAIARSRLPMLMEMVRMTNMYPQAAIGSGAVGCSREIEEEVG
jgi:hypothetical protein